jgi:hypothetical protein
MIPHNPPIFSPLDLLGRAEYPIAQGDVELGNLSVIDDKSFWGFFESCFIVQDMVMQTSNLSFELIDLNCQSSLLLGDGCKETVGDGAKDVRVQLRMGSKGYCNDIGQRRWF